LAFSGVPGGRIAAVAFFVLLVVAALGSAIAMLEGVVAVAGGTLQRHRPAGQSTRTAVVAASAVACFLVGLLTVWSFNRLASWHPLGALGRFRSSTAFDLIDELTSNLLLPAGGLALAMLAGWRLRSAFVADELGPARLDRVVVVLLRWVVPVVVIAAVVASCSA
jgi:NSS family neurotransmitter:Na+ symporter